MRENLLSWFCHVQRKMINVPMRKSELIQVEVAEMKRKTKDNINKSSRKKTCQLRSLLSKLVDKSVGSIFYRIQGGSFFHFSYDNLSNLLFIDDSLIFCGTELADTTSDVFCYALRLCRV